MFPRISPPLLPTTNSCARRPSDRVFQHPVKNVFIQPAATDDGTALGNALLGWHERSSKRWTFDTAFLGRTYSSEDIRLAIEDSGARLNVTGAATPAEAIAADITQGRIVALFRGGSEFGPRALGHRSILADPRLHDMRDDLNVRVKHREDFRPLAPMVLFDETKQHFDLDADSPYMLIACPVVSETDLPAITHADGSARVQTIDRRSDPFMADVLSAFARLSGVPVVLNTSFNDQEPIVETPADAIQCFIDTEIDVLYIEDLKVTKA